MYPFNNSNSHKIRQTDMQLRYYVHCVNPVALAIRIRVSCSTNTRCHNCARNVPPPGKLSDKHGSRVCFILYHSPGNCIVRDAFSCDPAQGSRLVEVRRARECSTSAQISCNSHTNILYMSCCVLDSMAIGLLAIIDFFACACTHVEDVS